MNNNKAQNSASLHPDGYIEIMVVGDQNYLTYDSLGREVKDLIDQLRAQGKPLLGLIDLSAMAGFDTGSNKAALELLENVPYDKVAMFGGNTPVTAVTSMMLQALGKGDRTKLFKTREAALAWLLATSA